MRGYLRRAAHDIRTNGFLNAVTVVIIALGILILGAYALLYVNAANLIREWREGLRVMVYLDASLSQAQVLDLKRHVGELGTVRQLRYISKEEALGLLREQMRRQASLLEHLPYNPLPDALELELVATTPLSELESLARDLEALPGVEEVEYGQRWLGRLVTLFDLLRLVGYTLGALFFLATVFIVANTIRIGLYARREEIEIMRLVGASDGYIKGPLFLEGVIQGLVGALLGLALLYGGYCALTAGIMPELAFEAFQPHFLPPALIAQLLSGSMAVGLLGCYLSLKQFLGQQV
jgi:cell division transport system permease protein